MQVFVLERSPITVIEAAQLCDRNVLIHANADVSVNERNSFIRHGNFQSNKQFYSGKWSSKPSVGQDVNNTQCRSTSFSSLLAKVNVNEEKNFLCNYCRSNTYLFRNYYKRPRRNNDQASKCIDSVSVQTNDNTAVKSISFEQVNMSLSYELIHYDKLITITPANRSGLSD